MSDLESGGCLCGAYRYEFPRQAVISAFHCHCKDCQKTTGSGKATIVIVPDEALQTHGLLASYTVEGTDGAHVTRSFCQHCGSPVLSHVEEMPGVKMIKAGSLENSNWLTIETSCWATSANSWEPVNTGNYVFDKNPVLT